MQMFQPRIAFLPFDRMIRRHPPGHIDREIVLFKPLSPLGQCLPMRSVVGERRNRLQVLPQAERHRNLSILRWCRKTIGKFDWSPRMQPRPHIPNGSIMKSITRLRRSIHATDAVHKPLHLRMAHCLTQYSHRHKRKLKRHAGQCSKTTTAIICTFAKWSILINGGCGELCVSLCVPSRSLLSFSCPIARNSTGSFAGITPPIAHPTKPSSPPAPQVPTKAANSTRQPAWPAIRKLTTTR